MQISAAVSAKDSERRRERHQPFRTSWGFAAASLLGASLLLAVAWIAAPTQRPTDFPELRGAPRSGAIYFIGNSMFGTGLDIELVRDAFPESNATFGYYNGHYSTMWYEAFRNSLIPSGVKPDVVIWGFRPTYAVLPAFRQNGETELEKFYDPEDAQFRRILTAAGDPTAGAQVKQTEGLLGLSEPIVDQLRPLAERRTGTRDALNRVLSRLAALAFETRNEIARELLASQSTVKISDLIVSFGSGGKIARADALVVDNGEQFVKGNQARFADSFTPLTAQLLKDAEIDQLVVIFRPRNAMTPSEAAYYADAVAFFRRAGIPFLDFVEDEGLKRKYYAKGDHYTGKGMKYVTRRMIEALKENGLVN